MVSERARPVSFRRAGSHDRRSRSTTTTSTVRPAGLLAFSLRSRTAMDALEDLSYDITTSPVKQDEEQWAHTGDDDDEDDDGLGLSAAESEPRSVRAAQQQPSLPRSSQLTSAPPPDRSGRTTLIRTTSTPQARHLM
jgi:hypothetical protein